MSETKTDHSPSFDAFLGGAFSVWQPRDGGHRAGLDAVLLAAAVPANADGKLADLGAGTGVAGLAASPHTELHFVENNSHVLELLAQTLTTQQRSGKSVVHAADVKDIANLQTEIDYASFDWVISNPPFNSNAFRASPNEDKADAHQWGNTPLKVWIVAAERLLKPSGKLAMIFRPDDLPQALKSLEKAFGAISILPIAAHRACSAKRIVLTAIKGRKTPLRLLPQFILHHSDGSFTAQADDLFMGAAKLSIWTGLE